MIVTHFTTTGSEVAAVPNRGVGPVRYSVVDEENRPCAGAAPVASRAQVEEGVLLLGLSPLVETPPSSDDWVVPTPRSCLVNWGPFAVVGKNAVVTGGAMGIGYGIVTRCVERRANVVVADLNGKLAASKVGELWRAGQGRCGSGRCVGTENEQHQ